ncbi:hypothetical protein H4R99_005832 [Coemansia sp. RSA 1722]|nr:hypothetical protein LPJ57_001051 [Coemansia sp. RSA 486]KAJ2237083.1 hypothetical protein IWW45_001255 [Coemansia sp. RSA 485]KAJ2594335.1 hypothetical protein H4R99_005832 [Coemansia sp. RSA 1722]
MKVTSMLAVVYLAVGAGSLVGATIWVDNHDHCGHHHPHHHHPHRGCKRQLDSSGTGQNPFGSGQDPSGTGQNPFGSGQDPSGTGQNPFGTGQNPSGSGSNQNPFGTGQNPLGTGQNPLGTGQDPSGSGQNPFGTGSSQNPFGTGQDPSVSGQNPLGSIQNQNQPTTQQPVPTDQTQAPQTAQSIPSTLFDNLPSFLGISFPGLGGNPQQPTGVVPVAQPTDTSVAQSVTDNGSQQAAQEAAGSENISTASDLRSATSGAAGTDGLWYAVVVCVVVGFWAGIM